MKRIMSTFITNSETKKLKSRIAELIANSRELRFLVGFFYFSGIRELYEELEKNPEVQLDVLVGLNVDRLNYELIEYGDPKKKLTDGERVNRFFQSVSSSINSDDFDTQEFYEQIKFFINLIKQDKLRIRKTVDPNHAKLYIFKLKGEAKTVKPTIIITGSSNLTKAGLMTQNEFNVEISDYGTKEAEDYFNQLWEPATRITEIKSYKEKLIDLIENKTLIVNVTPFEAFVYVLKNYIDTQNLEKVKQSLIELLEKKGYKPYKYQLDAVSQALTIIKNPDSPNGLIVSDVVGLGKSVIACLIARSLGRRGIVICPPGLIGDDNKKSGWQKYREDFGLHDWEIRPCGLENLYRVLQLVRDNNEYEVVIIDEVHRFRNQDTEAYEVLSNICRNKVVILLSATPFNNSPADIFSLLKLFVVPGKSKISLDNDLASKFKEYSRTFKKLANIKKNYQSHDNQKRDKALTDYESLFGSRNVDLQKVRDRTKYLSQSIRQVIEPVVVRRNRIDLKKDPEYSKEIYELSEVKDPEELFFELTNEQLEFYEKNLNTYFCENGQFKGAIYRPFIYEVGLNKKTVEGSEENFEFQSQNQLYDFMRRLLVKRFESSFGAFKQSIKNFYDVTEKVQSFIKNSGNKFILDRKLLVSIFEEDIDDIESALLAYEQKLGEGNYPKSYKVYNVNSFKDKGKFLDDIESDKRLFSSILKELDNLDLVGNDPKFKSLVEGISRILNFGRHVSEPERKVIVFTEYMDTAKYLEDKLEKEMPGKVLSVTGDLSNSKIDEILENFDANYKQQKDGYRVLLATDKISEGFNLNRAGAIINYDIPWNPTRVIQRVGRINRISKKVFDNLYIFNFFPTVTGAEHVRSKQIAAEKMFLIHNTLGEDAKIFDPDEEPTAAKLYKRIMENPEKTEEESFPTKLRRLYSEFSTKHPEVIEKTNSLPRRIKVAKKFAEYSLSVFMRKGLGFYIRGLAKNSEVVEDVPFEVAFPLIECNKKEKALPLSREFWEKYVKIKEYREQTRAATSETSIEVRARNTLRTLLSNPLKQLNGQLQFIRILLEDITEFKTLSDYTMRRIANLKTLNPTDEEKGKIGEELNRLKKELGGDYLAEIKEKLGDLKSEVIVAIENHR